MTPLSPSPFDLAIRNAAWATSKPAQAFERVVFKQGRLRQEIACPAAVGGHTSEETEKSKRKAGFALHLVDWENAAATYSPG